MSLPNLNLVTGGGGPAAGTILAVGNTASPLVYNPIGQQAKITTALKTDTANTTNQGGGADGRAWDQSIPTLLVGGEVGVEINYSPNTPGQDNATGTVGHSATSPGALMTMFIQQQIRPWKVTWPDGTGGYFLAYIMDVPVTADPSGKALTLAMKLKITGAYLPF